MKKLSSRYELAQEVSPEGHTEVHYKDRPKNLFDLMENTVSKWPEEEAFVDGDQRITYAQFHETVNRVSAALQQQFGIKKGDRVALLLGNCIPFAVSYFGIVRLGAVVVPLNTRYKGAELSYELNDSGAKALIAEPQFYEGLEPLRNELATISHIFIEGDDVPSGTRPFSALTRYESTTFEKPEISEWDLLNIMYTSGTTGQPKGAMHFHRGNIGTGMMAREFLNYEHGRDRILCIVPLFHVTGLSMNLIGPVFAGIPVVFMRKFNAEEALQLVEKERITIMVSVITIYWLMLNNKNFDKYDVSSLREILYGGSPAAADVVNQMREKLAGVLLHNGFGMTETHAYDTHLEDKDAISHIESVGQILPLVDMKIVDPEGREVPAGEPGELLIKGSKVVRGYWNKPEVNKEAFTDGWLHSGDIARIDEDGYVYIMDRIKDMINRGGEKIYSIEVENILYSNPKILDAAVFGVPDEVFGEQVKAAVVLKPDQTLTEQEVIDFCAQRLANYKIPRSVVFLDELPRNPGGKVVKSQLLNLK
jgi:long-chain acyl-CoA synthetase